MKHNTDHIRVSHAGNLPRPDDLNELLVRHDAQAVRQRMPSAVSDVVQRQLDCGVDIPNDGEYIKAGSLRRASPDRHRPSGCAPAR